jgi:hypothetical protein
MLIGIPSCSPVLYSTVGQNVPLFKEKGEVSMGAGFATTNDGSGLSVQLSGAVSNRVALLGSFYSLSVANTGDDVWSGNGSYGELAAGTFGTLNAKGNLVYEFFGGIGSGKIENSRNTFKADVKYFKPFIQPSFGFTSMWFEAAFTPRIGVVSYTDHAFTWDDPAETTYWEAAFKNNKTTLVFEPGLTFRTGYKGIKLQMQYSYTTFDPWNAYGNGDKPATNTDFFSIGLNYMITKRYKGQ